MTADDDAEAVPGEPNAASGGELGARSLPDAAAADRAAEIAANEAKRIEEQELLDRLGVDVDDPAVVAEIHRLQAGADEDLPFGRPGEPLSRWSPFRVGLVGALGVSVAVLLVRLLIAAGPILLLIGIALFLAIGLDPVVTWLTDRGLRRGFAVLVTVAAVLAFLGVFIATAVPPLVEQATELVDKLPGYIEDAQRDSPLVAELNERFRVLDRVRALASGRGAAATPDTEEVVGVAKTVFGGVASALTVVVLSLYFVAAFPRMKAAAYRLVPRSRRPRAALLADEILARIGSYLLGNLATSLVAGIVAYVFFRLFGVPYPLPLAMFVALTDLLPLVGATIGAAVSSLVAFGVSVPVGLITIAYFVLYQQFENFVLIPRVMKRAVDVSPIATIVAVLVGASLLGVFGAVLAVPIAASIQIIGREIVLPRQEAV